MRAPNPCLLQAVLFCILAISTVNSVETCKRGCPKSENGILHYQPGNVYEYAFDSVMIVGLGSGVSTESDETSLKLLGTAKVFAEGNCGYTLQMSAVKVSATKEAIEKKITQSIQKPIHFTLVNGELEPELCADPNDNQYALNIKRAIISLLQSSTEDGTEVDVFGQCTTHTSLSKVGDAQVVTKVRDLNQCRYRENTMNGLINGVVNQAAGVKSANQFEANYAKEAKISNGVIENVHLVEDYNFGVAEKGVPNLRGKIVTNLKLKNPVGAPAAAPQTGAHGTSVIFQKPEAYAAKNLAALKTALTQLVDLLNGYVKKDSAKGFTELIRLMRNADADTLLELAAVPHPNTVLARKAYLDALFRTGTAESAKSILKQLNKMDENEKLIAIISLNIVQNVDRETLNQAATLLTPNAPKQVYLSIGTLVSKYCRANNCEQGDIEGISKKFVDNLKHCKANTKKDEERILNVLKGITNMDHLTSSAAAILAECAATGRSTRIRVAALQAFSGASCDPVLAQKALALLRNHNEDSELRIEAYLAAINCPTAELANEIADIVNSEPVYQVGGFIASNLKAIRDSTDDTRAHQRYHLGNIRVTKHFPMDFRRYSFNNEVSYKLDALGLSASSDYKLIYSQNGFLPRSARLNVSTEIFGTNFNVFEISARQQNLENVLEYYVGPKGLLNKDFDEIMKMIEVGTPPNDRARRSIADETGKFAKKYKTYGSKNIQDINLDLSLKFFGSEMTFLSLGDQLPHSLDDIIKQFSSAFDNVKKELSSFNKEFNLHELFLDVNAIYPTGLGIPLELNMQGFAANSLDFGVNIDVDAILEQNWMRTKYQVKLVPSIDINLNMQLGFNAYVLATGVQLESSLHSATGADVKLDFINDGNGFNLDIETPRNKLELINVQVTPGFYVAELDKPVKTILPKEAKKQNTDNYHMCFNQFDYIGLNFCLDSVGVAIGKEDAANAGDLYSLVQPISINLYTEVERKYNLQGSYQPQTNSGSQEWKLELTTPGSKTAHTASVAFELGSKPRTYGRLAFHTPAYHFALEAGLNNDDKELVFYAQFEDNDNIKRNRIGFSRNGDEYRPIIEIQDKNGVSNEISGYHMDGRVLLQKTGDKQAKYIFENFQITSKDGERVVANGWVDVGPASLNNELRIGVGQDSYLVKGNFKMENGIYDIGFFTNDERTPDNVFGGSAHVQLAEQVVVVQLTGAAASWEVDFSNELQYTTSEDSTALASSKFKHDLTFKHKKNVVSRITFNGLTSGKNRLEVHAELLRGKKFASLSVRYNGNEHTHGDYVVEVNGKYNKHFADFIAKSEFNGNHFVVDNSLSTSWGTAVTVQGELGQRYTTEDIFIDLHGAAQFSKKSKQLQWILKVIGTPEKTNSELKISRDNAEVLKYNGELQHPQDKVSAGKINVSVKNVATIKADFKVAKNGKGEATVAVETQKSEEKHKIDLNSKFHIQTPKYELETTITFDGDKKIYFKTDSHVDKAKFSTKNLAEISNKQISLDAAGSVKGDWRTNGEIQGNFILTAPSAHIIEGSFKRKLMTNTKTGVIQGNMDMQLSETCDNKKRSLTYAAHADKFNLKTKEISQNVQVTYANFDDKKLELTAHVKHLPKDQSKTVDIKSSLRGDLVNIPVDVNFVVDEYDSRHAILRIDVKCGEAYNYNVNGRYNLGSNGSPATFEVQGNVQLPKSNIKSVQFTLNGKVLKTVTDENGAYLIELHMDERAGDSQFLRLNTVWKGTPQQGAYNFDVETKDMTGPLKLEGTYHREQSGTPKDSSANGKQKYAFNFNYADKFMKTTADLSYVGTDTAAVHYTLDSSFESAKNIDVDVRIHKLEADTYEMKIQSKSGDNVYTADSKLYQSKHKKGLDLHIATPDSDPIVVVGLFEIVGDRKTKLAVEIKNLIDLDFFYNAESSYKAIDDFYIQAQWNSAKLNLQNYDLDVRSEGKAIVFKLKDAQAVLFAGSATYSMKKENSKTILEGQGQVQYKGKSQKTNFRLIHQIYDLNVDKEFGFSYTLDGTFGPKNGVSTLKITNKDVNVKLSICEEKKQCTNVQVQSIVSQNGQEIDSPQHSLLIVIDLRELGYPYEFEFQSKTIRQGLKFQYSLESQIVSNNNMKYKLVANVMPTNSKIHLKLPQRELLLEAKQQFPEQGQFFGHYENSIAFYLDKTNKPNDVTQIRAIADVTGTEFVSINVKSEIKFEHPTIRPLTIHGKFDANRQEKIVDSELVFDLFRLPEQQIIASLHAQNIHNGNGFNITTSEVLHSNGLGFSYEFSGHTALNIDSQIFSAGAVLHSGATDLKAIANIYATKDHTDVSVYVMNEPILQFAADFNRQKYAVKIDSKLQLLSQHPVELVGELQPTQSKILIKRQGLLDLNANFHLRKELQLNINGIGKQLFNGHIALDAANFLQTTYNSNSEDIKAFLNAVETEIKEDTNITVEKIKNRFKNIREAVDKQVQLLKDSTPDLSQLKASYETHINEIIKELENDPALKQISETYHKIYTKIAKIAEDVSKSAAESYESLHKSIASFYQKLEATLKETVLPAWEELLVSASKVIGDLRVQIINLITELVQEIWHILEQYGPALKNYGKAINEALEPFNEAAKEFIKVATQALEEFIEDLRECFTKLPSLEALQDELKDRVKKLRLVENTLELLNNIFDQLHILPLTTEFSEFIDKLREYTEAKLTNKSIDDEQVTQELIKLLIRAVNSIWSSWEMNSPVGSTSISGDVFGSIFAAASESFDLLDKLPSLFSFRFSVFNFILNENWESFFSTEHLKSWIFFQEFDLHGHIADGHQIFTFDGQHYSFPGSCKYILAQDSVDNNFTIVAQLNNGKLKAVILTDRDGTFVEITDGGLLKVNGDAAEYSLHVNGIYAWRLFYTVWLYSDYGVEVMCTQDLKVCNIKVDGFYTSKTRGLLGNGNAEPNDDFIQVDGTLATDYSAHGNGYGLGKCAPIAASPVDANKRTDICTEIFSLESPLATGYLFENPAPFRAACDAAVVEAVEKDKETTACTIATAYGSALKFKEIPIRLPSRCLKCAGAVGQRELGQEFTVKIPNNKADIVFVVDMNVAPVLLSNLVAPAILEVRESLKTRGFTDVQIGVIAYNESQLYPALLTSDGGKINYQGNIANLQLSGPKQFCLHCVSQEVADPKVVEIFKLIEQFLQGIEPQSDEKAFRLALKYPFRAGAAKSFVAVRSNSLEYINLSKLIRTQLFVESTGFNGALLHLIGPVKDMAVEGIPNEKLVGFNSRLIATLDGKDAKKRQKLQFENDMGIDFVLDNGGWVFATQNFDQLKPNEQTKMLNQVVNTLADTLFKTEIVSECECEAVHGLHAQHQCTIKSSNFLPNKKVKA